MASEGKDIGKATKCPSCGLEASALLHRHCQHKDCPVRAWRKSLQPPKPQAAPMASEHTGGWRTMESAPKDGTPILLWLADAKRNPVVSAIWEKGGWTHSWIETYDHPVQCGHNPTHWMPLPDPPAALALTAGETDG